MPAHGLRGLRTAALACWAAGAFSLAWAQAAAPDSGAAAVDAGKRDATQWLQRLQQTARVSSYVGTFVVSSNSGAMSSARIWHVREGGVPMERVDTLSGAPRSTFRRNGMVTVFLPQARIVRTERHETSAALPSLFAAGARSSTADFYAVRQIGAGRVAGFEADIVQLDARDALRFGYRIWSEKRTGLVIQTQTLDQGGRVLEQAAFSELQLGAPVRASALRRSMGNTLGYRVEKSGNVRTTAEAEGWELKSPVPGFSPQGCYRRAGVLAMYSAPLVQWVFSDGLAAVSLFMEPFDAERHAGEGTVAMGATHTLAHRITSADGDWWVTAVGEVPPQTLHAFVENLQRRK